MASVVHAGLPRRAAGGVTFVGLFAAVGWAVVAFDFVVLALILVPAVGIFVATRSPVRAASVTGIAALAACWVTRPNVLPDGITLMGKTLLFSDFLLPLAALFAIRAHRKQEPWRSKAFIGIMLLAVGIGIANGVTAKFLVADLRGPLYLVSGYFIARSFADAPRQRLFVPAAVIVSMGAMLVGVSAVTRSSIVSGRAEAVVTASHETLGATRFLVPSTYVALALICILVCTALLKHLSKGSALLCAVCAFLLLLGFSRNDLVALAVAVAFTVATTRRTRVAARLLRGAAVGAAILVTGLSFLSLLPNQGPHDFVEAQIDAYKGRVLGGLSSSARRVDGSAQSRVVETHYAWKTIRSSPLLGRGWGTLYRPALPEVGGDKFWMEDGRHYVHNGYLWYWTKTGILGLSAFLMFALGPILKTARRSHGAPLDPEQIALAGTLLGLLAATFVVPNPFGVATAPIVGLLVGLLNHGTSIRTESSQRELVSDGHQRPEGRTLGLPDAVYGA
jgi:O-antigen ligase